MPEVRRQADSKRLIYLSNQLHKDGRVQIEMSQANQMFRPLVAAVCFLIANPVFTSAQEVEFEKDILPILKESCFDCHGPDDQESGFRVDSRVALLTGGDYGEPGIVPGDDTKGLLLAAISYEDSDFEMPPDGKLSDEKIELIKRWVKQGAVWPGQMDAKVEEVKSDHWSFQPVTRPEIPSFADDEIKSELTNPVDAFLLKSLKENELEFSSSADPQTLIRRASIVLTGIAPTSKQTNDFVAAYEKDGEQAYQSLVDRLLGSEHFGERWAQHWLDVIRWAETNGSEANLYRKNAWIYRDYVVRAFNEDKPYDEFVREQIAGDSLGVGEATGFLVAGPHVPAATVGREPTAIRQARADRMDEVMQTVGASMMGVTIGCARCHNHKFDPITIKDYYSLTGVFQDVEFGSRFPEYSDEHPLRQRGGELRREISKQRKFLKEFGGWEENWGAFRELHFEPVTTKAVKIKFKMPNIFIDELELFGPENRRENLAAADRGTKVSGVPEEGFEGRHPIERLIDGQYGTMNWRVSNKKGPKKETWVQLDFEEPQNINRLRMSNNREYFYDTDYLTKKPNLPRYEFDLSILKDDGTWQPWVGTWHVNKKLNEKHPERKAAINKIQKAIKALGEEGPRPSFVGRFVKPVVTRVLSRGSPENPRDEVPPAGPAILDGDLKLDSKASGSKRRAEFAKWISNSENPLTSRVMANRICHHVFGSGIVPTTADYGKAGAPPTHPELLEWLAAEFVEPTVMTSVDSDSPAEAWSMKSMIKMLVMSKAFRQSSAPVEAGMAKDAGAAMLWRFPPKRVEAEVIRDSVLQASGTLDRTIGGKSYRIHNEKKTYAQWEVLDNHGPQTWRRMLYQERMRRVDDRIFTAFDFPDCGQVRAKRPISTTPLQALNLMNSDFVLEQSKLIADRATKDAGGDEAKSIDRCFELLLCRVPTEEERAECLAVAKENDLSLVCRALINSNEFAFLP
jgi:mono/diheme cytochrome c family protein